MTKTEQIEKMLRENRDTKYIMTMTGASKGLISQCRKRIKEDEEDEDNPSDEYIESVVKKLKTSSQKKHITQEPVEEEEEVSDEEIDNIIKKLKITKEPVEEDEEYHCTGCNHIWYSKRQPKFCPNCGAEF